MAHIQTNVLPGSSKPGFFLFILLLPILNIIMSLRDKVLDAVEAVKWKLEDLVFTAKNKALDVVEYVKYDVLKKDLPNFDFLDKEEAAPKKKKKKTKKKKK